MEKPKKENIFVSKSFNFSLDIIKLSSKLQTEKEACETKYWLRLLRESDITKINIVN